MRSERAKSASTKEQLMRTAERLFALEGVDAVSLRRIAAEAGQRNGSVLQYHFGSREALIDAIVERRMTPLNARRRALLDRALAEAKGAPTVASLVTALVVPLSEQLLDGEQGAYYVRFMGELFARGEAPSVLASPRPWNEAFFATIDVLRKALPSVERPVLDARLLMMAGQMIQATSAMELELRGVVGTERRERIRVFAEQLVDYVAGALVAPSIANVKDLLRTSREDA